MWATNARVARAVTSPARLILKRVRVRETPIDYSSLFLARSLSRFVICFEFVDFSKFFSVSRNREGESRLAFRKSTRDRVALTFLFYFFANRLFFLLHKSANGFTLRCTNNIPIVVRKQKKTKKKKEKRDSDGI